jgi:pyruvate/2-oxoacid:ferredoxin oxidoreductase alpha subunit
MDTMNPSFATIGPIFERHTAFPQKINAEFVQVCATLAAKPFFSTALVEFNWAKASLSYNREM